MGRKARLKLGDRVRMTGTAVKVKTHGSIKYERGELPTKNHYKKPKTYDEGIIVGIRTVADGTIETEYADEIFNSGSYTYFLPDSAQKVWLVAFDLQMKPAMCFDDQVEAILWEYPLTTTRQ